MLGFVAFIILRAAGAQDWHAINVASIKHYQSGEYQEAIRLADRALIMAETKWGQNSSAYMSSLTNKAYAQSASGDYLKALANFKRTAEISFVVHQLPHVDQIETLGELAKTFMLLAVYDSTESYLNLARFIYSSIPEKNKPHYDTAFFQMGLAYVAINSLDASLHHKKGQVDEAIKLLEQQLPLLKVLYPDNYEAQGDYQTTLNNLSTFYNELFDLEKANAYGKEYFRLVSKEGDERDMLYALQNLGSISRNLDQNDSALYYWRKAVAICESGNYRNTHIHAVLLNNMGELLLNLERYDSAILIIKSSIDIQRSGEATQPHLFRTTLYNLAESYHWRENYSKADSVYTQLIAMLLDDITHNFTYLSDNEKISFYQSQQSIIEGYLSFALKISGTIPLQKADKPYVNPEIPGKLFDLQLATKAIILNAIKKMKNAILSSGDTTLIKIYNQWIERKNYLAQALSNGSVPAEEITRLKTRIEENEKWLTINSRSFQRGFVVEKVTWQQIQQQLKPGEAAVEIIKLLNGLVYAALIVTEETKTQPIFSLVLSTKSKHLDKQFYHNYHNAVTLKLEDTLSYKTYWKPVIDSIRNHMPFKKMPARVYISNDGIYNQINLNILKNPDTGDYVLDETEIVLLTNSKELLATNKSIPKSNGSAALFGQPQFSNDSAVNGRFADLPGTGKEVDLINRALAKANWHTQVFLSNDATEENLKNLNQPDLLHLASHGYFDATGEDNNSIADKMMRSAVVLAGADNSQSGEQDGLLTAFEMTSLDLDGTQLVVLSACETGKGVVSNGEGVYGLQRAVRVAGAQHMLMSLWKVDDTATQMLMVAFYNRWLKTKDMRGSFREAQRAMRKTYPAPYYWGAFILAGR